MKRFLLRLVRPTHLPSLAMRTDVSIPPFAVAAGAVGFRDIVRMQSAPASLANQQDLVFPGAGESTEHGEIEENFKFNSIRIYLYICRDISNQYESINNPFQRVQLHIRNPY